MTIDEEIALIDELTDLGLILYWQDAIVSRATGGNLDNRIYIYIRRKLLSKTSFSKYLPKWIESNRTVDQFWLFIKNRFSTYAERREFLWNELSDLIGYLESKKGTHFLESIVFDEAFINEKWIKATQKKEIDPEGSITAARTLIESVLKHILDEQEIDYNDAAELPELYKEVAKSLNLAPEQHQEQIFKQILGGVSSIVSGLGALRNKLGDAHGKSKRSIKPSERHSELAVNLSGAVSVFLFKTFKENKS